MMSSALQEVRLYLTHPDEAQRIDLRSAPTGLDEGLKLVESLVEERRKRIESVLEGGLEIKIEKKEQKEQIELKEAFLENYRKICKSVLKGWWRIHKDRNLKINEALAEEIWGEYQEMCHWVSDELNQGRLGKGVFKTAGKLTTYYSKEAIQSIISYESIKKTLEEEGVGMETEEIQELFTDSLRKQLVEGHIKDPLKGVVQVVRNLKEELTDKKIQDVLGEEEIEIKIEEVQDLFTNGVRRRLAVSHMKDPLGAVVRVAKNLKEKLTDEKIQGVLKEGKIEMEVKEVQELFTDSIRRKFAVSNINKPLEAVVKVAKNLKEKLTDENIQKSLKKERIEIEIKEIQELFTDGLRKQLAVSNINKSLEAVVKVAKNLKEKLTDENIEKALKEGGVKMEAKEIEEVFTDSLRKQLALSHMKAPLKAVVRFAKNLKGELTDEKIQGVLKEEGVEMEIREIKELFNEGVRKVFSLSYMKDPLGAVVGGVKNLKEKLTDEKIQGALKEGRVKMETKEAQEVFTDSARRRLAVSHMKDPLGAVVRVARFLKEDLTDEKLKKAIEEEEIEMEMREIKEILTGRRRVQLAINNMKDPLKAAVQVVKNLKEELTDEKIQEALNKRQLGLGKDLDCLLSEGKKIYFAIHNPKNPLEATVDYICDKIKDR